MSIVSKDVYTTKEQIVIGNIVEYDMVDAGYSLVKEFNQLSDAKITLLGRYNKSRRKKQIGIEMKYNKDFSKKHTASFATARQMFVDANGIRDEDIISVRKDAIFINSRQCSNLNVGNHIKFAPKNVYTSFHKLQPYEFYYNSITDVLHIKGMKDEKFKLHDDGMNIFLKKIFRLVEEDNPTLRQSIYYFVHRFKDRKLPIEFYRSYDNECGYYFNVQDDLFVRDWGREVNRLTMIVNYEDIIMKLMKIHYYKDI